MKNQEVKKSIETKENESGRSMVEMLGVLAIMGVLAIGGIAGYRWAMDKYNANEILNEVRKRAVTASQQRILGHAINLSEYGNNTIQGHAVTTTDNYDEDTNFFTITIEGIEKDICDKIIKEKIPFAVDTWVGVDSDKCSKENSNAITFAFANTLDRGATPSEPEPVEPTCGANEYLLPNGTCKADEKCTNTSQFWNGETQKCEACPTQKNRVVENNNSNLEDSCGKCNNAQAFSSNWGSYEYCVYCPRPGVVCGPNCCGEGEVCNFNTRTCVVSADCQQNSNCSDTCQQDSDCQGAVSGSASEGKAICDTLTGECVWGCKTNDDCQANYFCDLDDDMTDDSCTQKPGRGTCKSASYTAVGDTEWIKSDSEMNWWSAENFCKANNNKTLIDLSKKCKNNWSEIKVAGSGTCVELKGIESTYKHCWTKNMPNSCKAFYVDLYTGYVYFSDRNSNGYYALCAKESQASAF